jgi:alkyl sulfatase BDS1-like metallo-beta-lactamase superfamily hydrolase
MRIAGGSGQQPTYPSFVGELSVVAPKKAAAHVCLANVLTGTHISRSSGAYEYTLAVTTLGSQMRVHIGVRQFECKFGYNHG